MLKELRIRNFAIINELDVSFGEGLNVLTGETGAGKSIIVDALGVALGDRAYVEMIKSGQKDANVEAYFDHTENPAAHALGIDMSDGLVLRRSISSTGKGPAYVNGTMVNVQSLLEIGNMLVDIHGQHEHQSLLSTDNQLMMVDRFGSLETEREAFAKLYEELLSLRRRLADIATDERQRAQKLDLLKYQINEISTASPESGEDVSLEEERALLQNLSRLNELFETTYDGLYAAEGSCIERLASALNALREISRIDSDMKEPLTLLEEAVPILDDAAAFLRTNKGKYDLDPSRLDHVEERLEILGNLKRKYGETIDDVLSYLERAGKELEALEFAEEDTAELRRLISEKEDTAQKAAAALSAKRKEASSTIEQSITSILGELAMEKAVFRVGWRDVAMSSSGCNEAEFLFSANPGEDAKPLAKVVSGGELSRVMLAVKSLMRNTDDIPVLVFDEVDAGIGGKTAESVARKLKSLSSTHQVMCITHLPQIAAVADRHFSIEKEQKKNGVYVNVKVLSGKDREEEIARMLSGKLTEASLKHARELIGKVR